LFNNFVKRKITEFEGYFAKKNSARIFKRYP